MNVLLNVSEGDKISNSSPTLNLFLCSTKAYPSLLSSSTEATKSYV